jgi:hypothetical protein
VTGSEHSASHMLEPIRAGRADTVLPVMRGILGLAALLVFLAGVQLFLFPLQTDTRFAWTIPVPMTAVFLGASYWSVVALELGSALATRWAVARVAVPAVLVFSILTLVDTRVHLHKFHIPMAKDMQGMRLGAATEAVAWGWIGIYVVVPVLLVLGLWLQWRRGTAVPPPSGLPPLLRSMLLILAIVLIAVGSTLFIGTAMLEQAGWAQALWPWPLTPITAGAVGAWSIGLGVAAGHARLVDDPASLGPIGVTGVLFGVFQAVALLRYGDELAWGSLPSFGYIAALVGITAVGVWLLVASRRAHG